MSCFEFFRHWRQSFKLEKKLQVDSWDSRERFEANFEWECCQKSYFVSFSKDSGLVLKSCNWRASLQGFSLETLLDLDCQT